MTEAPRRRQRTGPSVGEVAAALRPVQAKVSALSGRVALLNATLRHRGSGQEHRSEAEGLLAESDRLRIEVLEVRRQAPPAIGASARFDDLLKSIDRLSGLVTDQGSELA